MPSNPSDLQPEEQGISLDQLSQAFAQMLGQGSDPYAAADSSVAIEPEVIDDDASDAVSSPDHACEITPQTIVEAMLFVGSPDNRPLTSQEIAGLMRGVRPVEIDEVVRNLNQTYRTSGCPYTIISEGAGYRLTLREQFAGIREKFYGRVRQAKLSPAAIEVLAMVAYNQPLAADEVARLRGKPSGHLLAQLVRRQLLRIERPEEKPRTAQYYTTQRFLEFFTLESLEDLPRGQELERQ